MFTARCGMCGDVQVVQHKSYDPEEEGPVDEAPSSY
jgi:hypothetical protein